MGDVGMGAIKHILYGHYMLITVELIKIRSLTVQEPVRSKIFGYCYSDWYTVVEVLFD